MHPIAEYRRARGLTQTDLAARVGVSLNSVQMWEKGALPRAHLLPLVAEALGVDALDLDRAIRQWRDERDVREAGNG